MNISLYEFSQAANMKKTIVEWTLDKCRDTAAKGGDIYMSNLFKIVDTRRDLLAKDIKCLEVEEVLMTERNYKTSDSGSVYDSSASTSRNNMRATKTRRG